MRGGRCLGTELCGGEPLNLVALPYPSSPALPTIVMRSVVQHARLGTPPAEEARVTGIMDPNIAKRIREKTVHLRQRLATTSAAQAERQHLEVLRSDWERRTRTYKQREEGYMKQITELEDAILDFHSSRWREKEDDAVDPMLPVAGTHRDIVGSLEELEGRSEAIRAERHRDLTRSHRARLLDWTKELDGVRRHKEEGMRKWKQRADALDKERLWAANLCAKLTTLNEDLVAQNDELRDRFKTGEDDRRYLIHQLAQIKKDTARCHQAAQALDDRLDDARARGAGDRAGGVKRVASSNLKVDVTAEHRKKRLDEIKRLETGLEHLQRNLLGERRRCAERADESTALQRVLRRRLLDLNEQLDDAQLEAECGDTPDESSELALLTWQSRVLALLYERAFPADRAGAWLPGKLHR